MCGRYFRGSDKQRLAEAFRLQHLERAPLEIAPSFNIAPTTSQPVIMASRDTGERELVAMRWGLIPHFAKSIADYKGVSTINAKAETLLTRTMWRTPFYRRRCLVPADGFYEWKKTGPKTKQPYAFVLQSRQPLAFAGLWDAWKDPATNVWLRSFTIITTDPNELTATIHDRMPVIIHPANYDRWLDRANLERPPLDLLRPYEAAAMTAYPVDQRVGSVRHDEPGLCEPESCPPNSL